LPFPIVEVDSHRSDLSTCCAFGLCLLHWSQSHLPNLARSLITNPSKYPIAMMAFLYAESHTATYATETYTMSSLSPGVSFCLMSF
jgi:hypothetical protein